jgi:hypothetical protein
MRHPFGIKIEDQKVQFKEWYFFLTKAKALWNQAFVLKLFLLQ